jgi:hypothetical protein
LIGLRSPFAKKTAKSQITKGLNMDLDKIAKGFIAAQIVLALVSLAVVVGVIWVAIHFISKYW